MAADGGQVGEAGGFAVARATIEPFIASGDLSGAVTLVWQGGKEVSCEALGLRDIESGSPMTRDTIFRIASMTKPITSVLALMLMEEGKLALEDPITKWAPEFADMRVMNDPKGSLDDTVPAQKPITVEDLMTHRSGLSYGFTATGPLVKAYGEAIGEPLDSPHDADGWVAGLASLPLVAQPGERMHYSHATELLGFLIGRIEGKPFGEVLRARILDPLGMGDTDFFVPKDKQSRLATLYTWDPASERLVPVPMPLPDTRPAYEAGGGGLFSTVDDYLMFARMLLNDGEVDGTRLLKPETVALMRTNRLTSEQRAAPFLGLPMWMASGFGLGLAVVDAPEKNVMGVGGMGAFTWPGAFGTWWLADPSKDLILIYLVAHYMVLGPDAGAMIAAGRGLAGRMALPRLAEGGLRGGKLTGPLSFYVYLLANRPKGTLYCGMTDDLAKRVWEHREKVHRGFTAKYDVTRLVWYEVHDDRSYAFQRERRIKEWKRSWKCELIEGMNPDWADLYDTLHG